jgi:hypothetical protein
MAATSDRERQPGSLLLDLLTLTGWQIETAQGDRLEVVAQRVYEGQTLTASASGASLADVSLPLFERACAAVWSARRRGASRAPSVAA